MKYFYLAVRYIPFWAVPMMMISGQFAYIYWLKSLKKIAAAFMVVALVCLKAIAFYYYHGGGEKAVYYFQSLFY